MIKKSSAWHLEIGHHQPYHKGSRPSATLVAAGPCCRCTLLTTESVTVRPVNRAIIPGKHPRTRNGVKDATTDRTIIKAWWKRWPDANIGIATGRASGIFVLDVDGEVGKASLKELKAQHGRLPKTVTVKTGKGRHRYFRCDGARVGNSVGHPRQGNRCPRRRRLRGRRWQRPCFGSHLSVCRWTRLGRGRGAAAPEWLLDLVQPKEPQATETESR